MSTAKLKIAALAAAAALVEKEGAYTGTHRLNKVDMAVGTRRSGREVVERSQLRSVVLAERKLLDAEHLAEFGVPRPQAPTVFDRAGVERNRREESCSAFRMFGEEWLTSLPEDEQAWTIGVLRQAGLLPQPEPEPESEIQPEPVKRQAPNRLPEAVAKRRAEIARTLIARGWSKSKAEAEARKCAPAP